MSTTSTDSGRRVVVIDDEKLIADTLALILRSEGYAAEVAYDGPSGLATCSDFHPHLVITDVVMPGMSGIEVAIELRQKSPNCTILLYSGQAATAQMMEDARCRGHDFELLAKPIHPAKLLDKVKSMLGNA
jgi:DNA-binding response OmpR family regulator